MAALSDTRPGWVIANAVLADVADDGTLRVEDGWLEVRGGRLVRRGTGRPPTGPPRIDAGGALVTPALVECHSHLLFAGNRIGDWLRRLGVDDADPRLGTGGIAATARATADATDAELIETALARARLVASSGVGTLEVKTGYGLDPASELRLVRLGLTLARRAARELGLDVIVTFLGLHAPPAGSGPERRTWIAAMTRALEALPGEVRHADAFVDPTAFAAREARGFLEAARRRGLALHLHVDQFGDAGGAQLAADLGALSADHLDATSPEGIQALAARKVVGVIAPIATVLAGRDPRPDVARLRAAGVALAVSADANPGTAPSADLRLAALLAIVELGLSPAEAYAGITVNAARALGRRDRGQLTPGQRADLLVWPASHPFELVLSHLPLSPWRPAFG